MSRTSSIGTTRIEVAIALIAAGFSRRRAAAYIGVAESTLRCALAADPVLAERVAQAQMAAEYDALAHIRRAMPRSWRAAAWYVEHTNRYEYGPRKPADRPDIPEDDDQKHVARMHNSHVLSAEQAKRQIEELDQHRPLKPPKRDVAAEQAPPSPAPPFVEARKSPRQPPNGPDRLAPFRQDQPISYPAAPGPLTSNPNPLNPTNLHFNISPTYSMESHLDGYPYSAYPIGYPEFTEVNRPPRA